MAEIKLKDYQQQDSHKPVVQNTVKSGVKSPNSDREMLVILPLERHPQISTLYKAIDPGTKDEKPWFGWVEYTPPTPEKEPDPQPESEKDKFRRLCTQYRERKYLLDLGLFTEEELGMPELAAEIKQLYKLEYVWQS